MGLVVLVKRAGKAGRWAGGISVTIALIIVLGSLAVLAGPENGTVVGPPLEEIARQKVAAKNNVPLDLLQVIYQATASYPLTGRSAQGFKVMDTRPGGKTYVIHLDASGIELDPAQLGREEQAAKEALYGKLDPPLYKRLATARPDEVVQVTIWLVEQYDPYPRSEMPKSPTTEEADAWFKAVDAHREAHVAAVVAPVVARLEALGYAVTAGLYAPNINAQLPPPAIRDVATWADVNRVYLAEQRPQSP